MSRAIRVFISSTFRDMKTDRDVLLKRVFPQLRVLCEARGVTWTEVDLRWGVTSEQAAEGEVLPYCLAEIDRSRPFFVGLLGARYGSRPGPVGEELLAAQPWLKGLADRSVTELEILHGVLNDPAAASRALFYFRDPGYARSVPASERADFVERGPGRRRLKRLKDRIRRAHARRTIPTAPRNYASPAELGDLVLADFTRFIDELFPADETPDSLDREALRHARHGRARRATSPLREEELSRLDRHVASEDAPLIVTGAAGGGKTTLLAGWVDRWRRTHPNEVVIEHFVGASGESTSASRLLARVLNEAKRRVGFEGAIPEDDERLAGWFAYLLARAAQNRRLVLVIDGADEVVQRADLSELRWLPESFAPTCRVIVSTGPGATLDALTRRGWPVQELQPLAPRERERLVSDFLRSCGKTLAADDLARIVRAPHASEPRYLRWLLEELRFVDRHDVLAARLAKYLAADGADELLGMMVRRWLSDFEEGCDLARRALTLLVAARDGLTQAELLTVLADAGGEPLPRATATPFFYAAEPAFAASEDRIVIRGGAKRVVREALAAGSTLDVGPAHARLARHFAEVDDASPRKLRELPRHLCQTEQWTALRDLLVRPSFLRRLWEGGREDLPAYWEPLRQHFDPAASYLGAWRELSPAGLRDADWVPCANAMGSALVDLGHPGAAADILRDATEAIAAAGGRDGREYARTARALGVALSQAGRHGEAASWLRQAVDTLYRTVGLTHPETMSALNDLATGLIVLGDLDAAEPILRRVVDANTEVFGREDVTRLKALHALAGGRLVQEDFAGAEPLQREVVETLSGIRAEDDRFHLTALNNWASILEAKGELAEAERVFRTVLAGRGRTLGYAHPETIQSLSNLAKLLHARGERDEAATLFRMALDRLDAASDTNPLERGVVASNLAALLADGGERPLAEALLRDSVERASAVARPDHPHLLRLQTNLGVFLLEGKDSAGAEPYLEAAAAGYARAFGREHPLAHRATMALAAAYAGQGQSERAKALFLEAGIGVPADDGTEKGDGATPPQPSPASPAAPEGGTNFEAAALTALANAHHYDDLYALTERFVFVTSVDFIARLEKMASGAPPEVAGALFERAALLRHLAAGKPLNAECNPVVEAFHALSRSHAPQDEAMLVRLYPFLCSRQVLRAMREMAASTCDTRAAVAVDNLARRFDSPAEGRTD